MFNPLKLFQRKGRTINNAGYDFEQEQASSIRREYGIAVRNPYFRAQIREASILEDEQNSYYSGILNTIADHCIGTYPILMGESNDDEVNDSWEARWTEWSLTNNIGTAIRHIRRGAAKTGIGIGIPYIKSTPEEPIGLAIKTVSSTRLTSPRNALLSDRIIDGIEYDSNWDIKKIYIAEKDKLDPTEYDIKDILFWSKQINEEPMYRMPECGPAFCLYPQLRRYMEAIVKSEEFRACIPLAVELDPEIYGPDDTTQTPQGKLKYEPGYIPTLPAGTKLSGLPIGTSSSDKIQFINLLISAAARCVQMPKNIAMGDSSGHNMATAAIDIQPWQDRVKIDRADFRPIINKIVNMWFNRGILVSGYFISKARRGLKFEIGHDKTFQHPDPKKNADARAKDLESGSTTLYRVYTDLALNPSRELNREARMLGITRQQLNEAILQKRVGSVSPEAESEEEEVEDDN